MGERELDRVGKQIGQQLAQPGTIAHDPDFFATGLHRHVDMRRKSRSLHDVDSLCGQPDEVDVAQRVFRVAVHLRDEHNVIGIVTGLRAQRCWSISLFFFLFGIVYLVGYGERHQAGHQQCEGGQSQREREGARGRCS